MDDDPGPDGRFGGALVFVRWSAAGDQPEGHVETEYLAYGQSVKETEEQVHALTLYRVKEELDRSIQRAGERPAWG